MVSEKLGVSSLLSSASSPSRSTLTSNMLPLPRLQALDGMVLVPAYTDLKLHDIRCASRKAGGPLHLVVTYVLTPLSFQND